MEGNSTETNIHNEINCRKERIFTMTDVSRRKTKIVCTLG